MGPACSGGRLCAAEQGQTPLELFTAGTADLERAMGEGLTVSEVSVPRGPAPFLGAWGEAGHHGGTWHQAASQRRSRLSRQQPRGRPPPASCPRRLSVSPPGHGRGQAEALVTQASPELSSIAAHASLGGHLTSKP